MKILSLNIWGGLLWEELQPFLLAQASDIDVFCFQEVSSGAEHYELPKEVQGGNPRFGDLFQMLTELLPEYAGYFGAELRNVGYTDGAKACDYGSAVFVRSATGSHVYSESFPYGEEEDRKGTDARIFEFSSRILQTITFGQGLAVHNFHGIWTGGGKDDCPARIAQSQHIKEIVDAISGSQVLCDDLNLWPDTKSLAILTEGNQDLIRENGVVSTRSSHYTKENKFADYAIVTPGVEVVSFQVLPDEVSDHLPLVLEIAF